MRPRTHTALALTILSAIALAGCSAPEAAPAPTVTVTTTETVTATPTPPAVDTPAAVGATLPLGAVTVTVHEVNQDPAPAPAPQPQRAGDKWVSADVESCNTTTEAFTVSGGPWTLVDAENRAFTQSSTGYAQFPQPDYAFGEQLVGAGECRRGWITFVVNGDATLTAVRYANQDGDVARWTL